MSRRKLSPKKEKAADGFIDKADNILQQEIGVINELKWVKEEIIQDIAKIKGETHEEEIKIKRIYEKKPKIMKKIQQQEQA